MKLKYSKLLYHIWNCAKNNNMNHFKVKLNNHVYIIKEQKNNKNFDVYDLYNNQLVNNISNIDDLTNCLTLLSKN